jgi:CrcB protein
MTSPQIGQFLAVCVAGGIGTGFRFVLSQWFGKPSADTFPVGILVVNLVGCLLLGVLVAMTPLVSPTYRAVLGVGLLGGFTTYATFNQDTLAMALAGHWTFAAINVGATLIGCLVAGGVGLEIGRILVERLGSNP